jgi:hypothetical protein
MLNFISILFTEGVAAKPEDLWSSFKNCFVFDGACTDDILLRKSIIVEFDG